MDGCQGVEKRKLVIYIEGHSSATQNKQTYLNSSPVSVDIIDKHSSIVNERDPGIIIAFPCMLMLHRSSTDDIVVDRPNDEKVEISLMIIYYY